MTLKKAGFKRIVVYEDDVTICYRCGCRENKLEVLPWESPDTYCKAHKGGGETGQ